jgi:hypothetical protein
MICNAAAGPEAAEPMEAAGPPLPAGPAAAEQRNGSSSAPIKAEADDDDDDDVDDDLLRCVEAAEAGDAAKLATPHMTRVVSLPFHVSKRVEVQNFSHHLGSPRSPSVCPRVERSNCKKKH